MTVLQSYSLVKNSDLQFSMNFFILFTDTFIHLFYDFTFISFNFEIDFFNIWMWRS